MEEEACNFRGATEEASIRQAVAPKEEVRKWSSECPDLKGNWLGPVWPEGREQGGKQIKLDTSGRMDPTSAVSPCRAAPFTVSGGSWWRAWSRRGTQASLRELCPAPLTPRLLSDGEVRNEATESADLGSQLSTT